MPASKLTPAQIVSRLASRKWVTLSMVARLAGVAYPTILHARKKGHLRAIPVGKHYRVYEDELIRFLTEGNYLGDHTFITLQEMLNEEQNNDPAATSEYEHEHEDDEHEGIDPSERWP